MADLENRLAGLAPALNADTGGGDFADVLRRRNRNRVTRTATVAAVVLAMVTGSALAATSLRTSGNDDVPRVTNTGTPEPTASPDEEVSPTPTPDPKMEAAQAAARAALAVELDREARLASAPLVVQDVLFLTAQKGLLLGTRCTTELGCMNEIQRTTDGGAHWIRRQALTPRIAASYPWDFVAPDRERWMVSRLVTGNDGVLYAYGAGLFGAEGFDATFTGGASRGLLAVGPTQAHGNSALDAICHPTSCYLEFDMIDPLAEGAGVSDTAVNQSKASNQVMGAVLSGEYALFALQSSGHGFAELASIAGSDGTQFTTTAVPCPGATSVSLSSDAALSIWMLCTAADGAERLFHTTDGRHFSELPQPSAATDTEAIVATEGRLWRWGMTSLSSSTDGGRTWNPADLPGWDPKVAGLRAFHMEGSVGVAVTGEIGHYTVYATADGTSWSAQQARDLR